MGGGINLERNIFEMYWSYYLSIEKMMKNTSQYVCPSKFNKNTYSAEIDSILKLICKENNVVLNDREYNMSVYAKVLVNQGDIKKQAFSPKCATSSMNDFFICLPFETLDGNKKYAGL